MYLMSFVNWFNQFKYESKIKRLLIDESDDMYFV